MAVLNFKPVTETGWADFEALFGAPGGPKYCWCMVWRATPEEAKHTASAARKKQMQSRIEADASVGLLGYLEGAPMAWVSIAPRDSFRRLGGPQAEPNENLWSLTCMYMHKSIRGQGHGHALIKAAIAHAKQQKADVLEAYPVDPKSPSYRFMGFVPAFEAAGFTAIGKAGTRRHVMRLTL